MPGFRDYGQQLVAIDDLTLLIDDDDPVGIAIERDADIGAHLFYFLTQRLGRGGAAFFVDVGPVGIDANLDHFGAKFPQGERGDLVSGAIGAIDDDAPVVELQVARQRALGELDITLLRALDPGGAAYARGVGQQVRRGRIHKRFDLFLDLIGELVTVGPEQLDAVVGKRVVGGRNHHAQVRAQRARQHGDSGRRHRAEQKHVHADGGESRLHGGLDHVARKARVLANHDAVAMRAAGEQMAGRHAHFEGDFGRHGMLVGLPANAVGAEIASCHQYPLQCPPEACCARSEAKRQ